MAHLWQLFAALRAELRYCSWLDRLVHPADSFLFVDLVALFFVLPFVLVPSIAVEFAKTSSRLSACVICPLYVMCGWLAAALVSASIFVTIILDAFVLSPFRQLYTVIVATAALAWSPATCAEQYAVWVACICVQMARDVVASARYRLRSARSSRMPCALDDDFAFFDDFGFPVCRKKKRVSTSPPPSRALHRLVTDDGVSHRLYTRVDARLRHLDGCLCRIHAGLREIHLRSLVRMMYYRSSSYLYSVTRSWLTFVRSMSPLLVLHLVNSHLILVAGVEPDNHSKVPQFSGQRDAFLSFFIAFSGYVAWKQHDVADLLEGDEPRPVPRGLPDANPVLIPLPIQRRGNVLANLDAIRAAAVAYPDAVANADDIADWDKRNKQLYGLLLQALPSWLKTSVYNGHRNDGCSAIRFLRGEFDAVTEGDYTHQLKVIQQSVIDPRADLNDADLRAQHDHIMTACAAIERTGHDRPPVAALKAMMDNALPASYNTIRQLVRRQQHGSFVAHYADYLSQVRDELSSRVPIPRALTASNPQPRAPGSALESAATLVCLNCGADGHSRNDCTKDKTRCGTCGSQHLTVFCTGGSDRHRLSRGAAGLIDREAKKAEKKKKKTYAAVAGQPSPPPATWPPLAAPSPAVAPPVPAPLAPQPVDPQALAIAHAAAASAASTHADPQAAAAAYSASLRSLGWGLMTFSCQSSAPVSASGTPTSAMVDSMATFWVVPSVDLLWRVTNAQPGFALTTADGLKPVEAVGVVLVYLRLGTRRECYAVPNVVVMPGCADVLYSTRVMRDCFGFRHDLDSAPPCIRVPGACDIAVDDDGAAFKVEVGFVPRNSPRPRGVHFPQRSIAVAQLAVGAAFPAGVAGSSQAVLFHRLGFPHAEQWQHVPACTTGHGLPPATSLSTSLPLREAVARGRARATPFYRPDGLSLPQPAPGACVYMDFAGPLIPSQFHRYTAYCCTVDAGSGYGRAWPCHHMTAAVAEACLDQFIADLRVKMALGSAFTPQVVRSDQGPAFVAHHFREFLAAHHIHQSLACVYTPQQNSHAERFWGMVFATARVLLAAANLPPSFHSFAVQMAAWLHNRLPRSSRSWKSPIEVLSHAKSDLSPAYAFGCLCSIYLPDAWREGDRHVADRGAFGLYLGPSELSPGHVVYLLSTSKVVVVPNVRVWEDEFPGIKGDRYTWCFDFDVSVVASPDVAAGGGALPPVVPPSRSPDDGLPNRSADPISTSPNSPVVAADSPAVPSSLTPPAVPADAVDSPLPTLSTGSDSVPVPQQHVSVAETGGVSGGARHKGLDGPSWTASPTGALGRDGRPKRATSQRAVGYQYAQSARVLAPAYSLAVSCMPFIFAAAACWTFEVANVAVDPAMGGFAHAVASDDDNALVAAASAAAFCYAVSITADYGALLVPKSYRQAMASPQVAYWREAIAKELKGLTELHTWDLVPISTMPPGANLMHCHFVFAVKRLQDGSVEKFKARLVADGNTQKFGVDFDKVFATVVKTQTIRLCLIMAAARDYNLSSIDITQAYLQAELGPEGSLVHARSAGDFVHDRQWQAARVQVASFTLWPQASWPGVGSVVHIFPSVVGHDALNH